MATEENPKKCKCKECTCSKNQEDPQAQIKAPGSETPNARTKTPGTNL